MFVTALAGEIARLAVRVRRWISWAFGVFG